MRRSTKNVRTLTHHKSSVYKSLYSLFARDVRYLFISFCCCFCWLHFFISLLNCCFFASAVVAAHENNTRLCDYVRKKRHASNQTHVKPHTIGFGQKNTEVRAIHIDSTVFLFGLVLHSVLFVVLVYIQYTLTPSMRRRGGCLRCVYTHRTRHSQLSISYIHEVTLFVSILWCFQFYTFRWYVQLICV